MSKIWIATCTNNNCATTFTREVEAKSYTEAVIQIVCSLTASSNDCYVVDLVEKSPETIKNF